MFFNKPAGKGTVLPWHQDRWNNLDRDPLVTIWTAMDPSTPENGCVEIVPGSHRLGVVNPENGSGFMTEENAALHCSDDKSILLELEAGEVALLHNWVMHRSGVNESNIARRAFSTCYTDARTKTASGETWPILPRRLVGGYEIADANPTGNGLQSLESGLEIVSDAEGKLVVLVLMTAFAGRK